MRVSGRRDRSPLPLRSARSTPCSPKSLRLSRPPNTTQKAAAAPATVPAKTTMPKKSEFELNTFTTWLLKVRERGLPSD